MASEQEISIESLQQDILRLNKEIAELKRERTAIADSPFLKKTVKHLKLSWTLDRKEVVEFEFGKRIDEKHGSMYDVKNQAHRYAQLLGIDPDPVRMGVTEAMQNILEHGDDQFAFVDIEVVNDIDNPHMAISFKHYLSGPEKRYTLEQANNNAQKGDITSEFFDFEDSRGRGEFIMKEVANERKIINGTEIDPSGQRKTYFKRILIFYRDPTKIPNRISFAEIKAEIDRLDYEDVICCIHVNYNANDSHKLTVASHRSKREHIDALMKANGYELIGSEIYYRTLFSSYHADTPGNSVDLQSIFKKIKKLLYDEEIAALP